MSYASRYVSVKQLREIWAPYVSFQGAHIWDRKQLTAELEKASSGGDETLIPVWLFFLQLCSEIPLPIETCEKFNPDTIDRLGCLEKRPVKKLISEMDHQPSWLAKILDNLLRGATK